MNFTLPKIYPITDVRISGISHAEQVEKLIAGGAGMIQLREKCGSSNDFYHAAKLAVDIAHKHNAKIIINDRVDIAMALEADGVHLGQDDLPPENARAILGPNAIIGFSTHLVSQAVAAVLQPIDYIAIGPIFETTTKQDPDAALGVDGLKQVRNAIGDFPLVAIGGITAESIRSVFDAGADSAAMIGAIVSDGSNIEDRLRDLVSLCEQ